MATTTAVRTHSTGRRSAPRTPDRTAPPPLATPTPAPAPALDLRADDKVMGWIDGMAIGFRGFADEEEAAHAAWMAFRTMSRRFAREGGQRLVPIDTVPMALSRDGDVELILAADRPIATLVRPGSDSPSGPDSFGFELQAPMPVDALTMRSTAYLVYRTLRRSGIRWAMWAPAPPPPSGGGSSIEPSSVEPSPTGPASTAASTEAARATRRADAARVFGTVLIVLGVLSVVILPAITASMVIPLLGGAAGLIALAALASLVHLVATDVRDRLRAPRRPTRTAPRGDDRVHATPARMAA